MELAKKHAETPNYDDAHVDVEIAECLDIDNPKSFFLFAGAGSGKTRSLVRALEGLRDRHGKTLRLTGQRIAVITYTNAACEEIQSRLKFDPLIEVSTIHSFAWSLIEGFNADMREWLRIHIADDIRQLEADEAKGRKGTKASATRLSQIDSKRRRLDRLDGQSKFIYSPTGENRGRGALSHSEVIGMCAEFLNSKTTLQNILVGGFPFLLIDESQDTNKHLVDAFFSVQAAHKERFSLGLLGDMMQRIYNDGKEGLDRDLPGDWATPAKILNHRSPERVIRLINKVRSSVDSQVQKPRSDKEQGHVRFFILDSDTADKPAAEHVIGQKMAEITGDPEWSDIQTYKCLTLEHRMAARRMGFLDLFAPLYGVEEFRTGLLNGTLPATRFFSEIILELVKAHKANDQFAVARIVRKHSPLLGAEYLRLAPADSSPVSLVGDAVADLMRLWSDEKVPTFAEILRKVDQLNLFEIPDSLTPNAKRDPKEQFPAEREDDDEVDRQSARSVAIDEFLAGPFSQIEPYALYVTGKASFDTHQGVKGLQFPRVMVIMDDAEARGFLFKYDNLFGGKAAGDPSVESTRRLFYVTCSRAEKSLALVAYSQSPQAVKSHVLGQGWFDESEIEMIASAG